VTGESYKFFYDSYLPPHMDWVESQLKVLVRRDSIALDATNLFYYSDRWIESPVPYFLEMAIANCDSHFTEEIICSYFVDNWPSYNKLVAGLEVLDGNSLNPKWSRADTCMYWNPNVINGLAVADLNKDGINDIVAAYSDGHIKVIDGVTSADSAISSQTIPISFFAFGNVDEDAESEACISDGDSLILLEVHSFTAVENQDQNSPNIPLNFELSQNYPNPFNSSTVIRYLISDRDRKGKPHCTTLEIYNILGQEVKTLVDEGQPAGYYQVLWDGRDRGGKEVSSGIYFCRLEVKGEKLKVTRVRKLLLLR